MASRLGQFPGHGTPALLAETQNVSARGVYFYLDQALPLHVTLTDSVRIRFRPRGARGRVAARCTDGRGSLD